MGYIYFIIIDGRIESGWEFRSDAMDNAKDWRMDGFKAQVQHVSKLDAQAVATFHRACGI